MTVTLTNTSGRLKTFTLPHESFCAARGRCACAMTPGRDPRRVPSSLTLAAEARLEGVDEAVLAVPEVDRAVRAGELRVERKPPAPQRPVNPDPNDRRAGKRTRDSSEGGDVETSARSAPHSGSRPQAATRGDA